MFWSSLFRAGLCALSWDITLQIHFKPETKAVYKDSTTAICRKLSSQLSASQEEVLVAAILQLSATAGSRYWKTSSVRGRHTLWGDAFSSLRVKPCPLLLPASSCWEKQSRSEVTLCHSIRNPQINHCSYWASGTASFLDQSSSLHILILNFPACHKPDQPSFLFLVSFSFSYICLPDLKSSVCLCSWETREEFGQLRAGCLLGGLPIWSLSEQVAQPTSVFWGDAWPC